jgi:hypothetical protein
MTSRDRHAEDREALARLLDIHGADRTRWPARERLRFAGVISEDEAAARLLAEAEALDRLLDRAPRVSDASIDALKDRIVAAALRSQRPQLAAVPGGKAAALKAKPAAASPMEWVASRYREWPAAAVLAASLVLGVMIGSAGTLDTTMQRVASVTGFSANDSTNLAQVEEVFGTSDEDLL